MTSDNQHINHYPFRHDLWTTCFNIIMNKENYQKLKRYAFKVRKGNTDHLDMLHDAYLYWVEKKNRDLFDENNSTACAVIKNIILHDYQKRHVFMKNGEKVYRSFEDIDTCVSSPSPDTLAGDHLDTHIRTVIQDRNNNMFIYTFDGLVEGYSQKEIAESLGVTPSYVSWMVIQMRNTICSTL